jgi:hypothetical protein
MGRKMTGDIFPLFGLIQKSEQMMKPFPRYERDISPFWSGFVCSLRSLNKEPLFNFQHLAPSIRGFITIKI